MSGALFLNNGEELNVTAYDCQQDIEQVELFKIIVTIKPKIDQGNYKQLSKHNSINLYGIMNV